MATEMCFECRYEGAGVVCMVCNKPVEIEDRMMKEDKNGTISEVKVKVKEPLCGAEFEFTASVEDEGIMFATPYDYRNMDANYAGDCEERNEDAWAALDDWLGFDVGEIAVESGIGASAPFGSCCPAIAYAILPFELALLIRRAVERGVG